MRKKDSQPSSKSDPLKSSVMNQISFCLALPRLISSLFFHIRCKYPSIELVDHIVSRGDSGNCLFESFLMDALHTIVGMHEIRAKLWVRNGDNARSLVHVYRTAQFCGTTFDLDHHLVQFRIRNRLTASNNHNSLVLNLNTLLI